MMSGPGPPAQVRELLDSIAVLPSHDEKKVAGRQLLKLCKGDQQLIGSIASSMEFISLLPDLFDCAEIQSFLEVALSLSISETTTLVRCLQQVMRSSTNPDTILLQSIRAFLESICQGDNKSNVLLEQGLLSSLIESLLLCNSNVDYLCELLRTIGAAIYCSAVVRHVCYNHNLFGRVQDVVSQLPVWAVPATSERLLKAVLLVSFQRCSIEFDKAWQDGLCSIAPGSLQVSALIPLVVNMMGKCSNEAQAYIYKLLSDCMSKFESNMAYISSLSGITELLLAHFEAIVDSGHDMRRSDLLAVLKQLLLYRPSAVAVQRLMLLFNKDSSLLEYAVHQLLLPGIRTPFIRFSLQESGISCVTCPLLDVGKWPPQKGYSIGLWFIIDSVENDIRLASFGGIIDLYIESGHLKLESRDQSVTFTEFEWVTGVWYHLVVTHERRVIQSSVASIFVNGELVRAAKFAYPSQSSQANSDPNLSDPRPFLVLGTGPVYSQPGSNSVWRASTCVVTSTFLSSQIVLKWFGLGRNFFVVANAQKIVDQTNEYVGANAAIEVALIDLHPNHEKSQHTRSLSLLSEIRINEQFIPGNSVVCSLHAVQSRISLFPYPNKDFGWVLNTGSASVQDHAQSVGDVTVFSPFGLQPVMASVGGLDHFLVLLSKSHNTSELNLRLLAIVLLLRDSVEALRQIVTNSKFVLLASQLRRLSHFWDPTTLNLILAVSGLSSEGKHGRIYNNWAFQSIIMDLSVWEACSSTVKKLIVEVIGNVIAVHPARHQNLSAINSGVNPISKILGILGNDNLGHEMLMELTHLLGIFVSRSNDPEDFAMVCDSAIAAVQIKSDMSSVTSRQLHGAHSFENLISVDVRQAKVEGENGTPVSSASSVKLNAYSTWALDRRLRLLEMLLNLARTAFEEGHHTQLKIYAEAFDPCFAFSLIGGGGHPQRRMVEIALQMMNIFCVSGQSALSNFASPPVYNMLAHLLGPYSSNPEIYSLLVSTLCGFPYMVSANGPRDVSLIGFPFSKLIEDVLLLPAGSRASSFPEAGFILIDLIATASNLLQKRPSITQRQGSISAVRTPSAGSRRVSDKVHSQISVSPAHRRSVSPDMPSERFSANLSLQVSSSNLTRTEASGSKFKPVASPKLESKRHSYESPRRSQLKSSNANPASKSKYFDSGVSQTSSDLDFLSRTIQGIIDVLAMSSASSTTSDPLKPLYSISFIKKIAQVAHLFDSIDAVRGSAVAVKLETLLIDIVYRAMFHSRSDHLTFLRQILFVVPVESCIDFHQSRWLTLLFNRLSDYIYMSFDLQQNSLLRSSLLASVTLLHEQVHLGRYIGDSIDLITRLLNLNRYLGDHSPTSDGRSVVSHGLINASKSMILFELARRDVILLQEKVRLHNILLENAHLLISQDDADFAGCVLYHAGLHLIHDNLSIQLLGINIWRWVLNNQIFLAENFLVWHYESPDGMQLNECNLLNNSFDRLLRQSDEKFSQWLNRSGNREAVATMTTEILRPIWQSYESSRQRECLHHMSKRSSVLSDQMQLQLEVAEKGSAGQVEMEFAVLHQLKKVREREVLRLLSARQNAEEASKAALAKWEMHVLYLDRIRSCQALSRTQRDQAPSIFWKDLWRLDLTEGPNRIRSKLKRFPNMQQEEKKWISLPKLNIEILMSDNDSDSELYVKPQASPVVSLNVISNRRRPLPITPHSRSRLSSFSISHVSVPPNSDRNPVHDPDANEKAADSNSDLCEFWLRGEQRLRIMLEPDCQVQAFYPCRQVIGLDEIDCIFVLCPTSMSLVAGYTVSESGDVVQSSTSQKRHSKPDWHSGSVFDVEHNTTHCKFDFSQISRITKCRYLLLPCGIEISFNDGNNFLLVFSVSDQKDLYDLLIASCPRLMDPDSSATLFNSEASKLKRLIKQTMLEWQNGQLTNFDYLLQLSLLSKRTFNDLTQYPVFPWVVQDYQSEHLDLESPSTFRDLKKPIGALDSSREQMFRERFDAWDDPTVPKFHYGTHYSSAPVVLSYLVRVEPFTSQFKRLHGGRFDKPDRMFHDIGECWNMCSGATAGTSDVRELLPEFYFMPEFLVNGNQLDLGMRSSGVETNHVLLPPWASNNPRKFISVHRRALESDHVSAHLHHWIDLIYGFKQQDQAAVDACNVFYYTSYEGKVDFTGFEHDPVRKSALIEQVRSFGQTPKQLFTKPHPARVARSDVGHLAGHPDHVRILDARSVGFPVGCIALNGNKAVVSPLCSAFIGPSNTTLVSWAADDGLLRIMSCSDNDPTSLVAIKSTHCPGSVVTCVQLSSNGIVMVTGATDACIAVSKRVGPRPDDPFLKMGCLIGHTASICSLAVSTEFSIVVSACVDNVILVWDLNLLEPVGNLVMPVGSGSSTMLLAIDCTGNGDIAVAGSGVIKIWDRNCHEVASTQTMPVSSRLTAIEYCTSTNLCWSTCLITGHADGSIVQWFVDFDGRIHCRLISDTGTHTAPVSTLMIADDSNQFCSGDTSGSVLRWGIPPDILAELRAGPDDAQSCPICIKKFKSKTDSRQFCPSCQATYCGSCWLEHYRVRDQHRLSARVFAKS